ncbi:site-specific integrase [Tamlana fucoidanivorans]|uniref:Site-specific integrase n=1 Tax=Allotamlana fucoidanivorans TaxID=2583814 RepID=A0A5C4SFU9_9FLAO|nr:site-specific integrase [Tamlana fucoidanivorans]TNJ42474.1 site-specific integrase [Tamlana fucoidanivorans]
MLSSKQIHRFAYDFEYESAYDLPKTPKFSNPKIYSAKGDLSKRWYVYFSYEHPETGKLKRLTPFYGQANKYQTKEERMEVLVVYRKALLQLLKQGYNPFSDNTELHNKLNGTSEPNTKPTEQGATSTEKTTATTPTAHQEPSMSTKAAFDFALQLKEKEVSPRTFKDYSYKAKYFLNWITETHSDITSIDQLTKKLLVEFLNQILLKTSARNRNNYRVELGSLLQVLENNELITTNPVKHITILKSQPKRNKTYSQTTQESIFKHLEVNDPILLLYIKFLSYNFLRPVELCRLKIGDINLKTHILEFKAKNSPLKTKIIPDILWQDLPDLSQMNKDDYLFTPKKLGGQWAIDEVNKRDYFTKRFKKVVKDVFKLEQDYTLYSFRHTFITKLYRALSEENTPFEAKSKLMLITGHSSMKALEKYLRDIDAELPADYSNLLSPTNG